MNMLAYENIIEHDLSNMITLEEHLVTLENYRVRAEDGNLRGRDLDHCYNLCAFYDPTISTESLTVSTEIIGTVILTAVGVIIGAIIFAIMRVIKMVKQIGASEFDEGEVAAAIQEMGGTKLSGVAVEAAIEHLRKNASLENLSINKYLEGKPENNELTKMARAFRDVLTALGGTVSDEYTIKRVKNWMESLNNGESFLESIANCIISYDNKTTWSNYRALVLLSIDIPKATESIVKNTRTITDAHADMQEIIRGNPKNSYHDEINDIIKIEEKARDAYIDRKTYESGMSINKEAANKQLRSTAIAASQNLGKLNLGSLQKTIQDIVKSQNPKQAGKSYIEPFGKYLSSARGAPDEKQLQADLTRIGRTFMTLCRQWITDTAQVKLVEHRYYRFVMRSKDIQDTILKYSKLG